MVSVDRVWEVISMHPAETAKNIPTRIIYAIINFFIRTLGGERYLNKYVIFIKNRIIRSGFPVP
jgi:hypothetical protein